jgi:hypothetical protein
LQSLHRSLGETNFFCVEAGNLLRHPCSVVVGNLSH